MKTDAVLHCDRRGDLIDQSVAARVGRMARSPDHGELDDLVDVARTQQDRFACEQRFGPAMLPEPVEATVFVVEAQVPVAVRIDQVGGEGQIVRARLSGLFRLAQLILRRLQ
ncbi:MULTISPECIES: hypothetical protein [unclassified Streptomyces]|uniref:hypothetical protein n=1 Tax=unclassified Streptomyces TaxID=2593676 RepID=UPI00114CEC85|nr:MULTISPECIES: hypothetical protein [unclassified Streptomyces]MDQ0700933.1 hypothetical protein [Streptomyces sp. W4I9-2]